jgi:hypothetical protein
VTTKILLFLGSDEGGLRVSHNTRWSNLLGAMDAIRTPITFVGHGKACAGQSA